jgi:hypothetical protein
MKKNLTPQGEQKSGISRRTILRAAALSAPVVVFGAATPAFAAGPTLRIYNAAELEQAYTGVGWYALEMSADYAHMRGLLIDATSDGTTPVAAGERITVTLPAGMAFADGTTAKAYLASGAARSVTVPAGDIRIVKGAVAGRHTIEVAYLGVVQRVTMTVLDGNVVHAWGDNAQHQVRDENQRTIDQPIEWEPTTGQPIDRVWWWYTTHTAIASGHHTLSTYTDLFNTVVTSGNGRTANGSEGRVRLNPGAATSLVTNNKSQAANVRFFWAADGTLQATGDNAGDMFSLGDGTPADGAGRSYVDPVKVGGHILAANPGKHIVSVHTGGAKFRAAYVLSDGTVWHSGGNTNAAMGIGTGVGQSLAAQTLKAGGAPLTDVVSVATGEQFTVFLDRDGNIWAAGANDNTEGPLPGLAVGSHYFATPVALPEGKTVKKVWAFGFNTIVQATDGTCYIAGANDGGLGSTGSPARSRLTWTKVSVPAGKTVEEVAIGHGAMYKMTDGTVYFAGNNAQSGNGRARSDVNFVSMTQVPLAGPAVDIAVTAQGSYAALVPNRYSVPNPVHPEGITGR